MADIKAALYSFLTSQSAITDHLAQRIYPFLAPATTMLPYMTYQRIGYLREKHLTGQSPLTQENFQFDIWGGAVKEAEDTVLAVKDVLDGYRGLMDTLLIERLLITNILDGLEEPSQGLTQGIWRHTISADIWYQN